MHIRWDIWDKQQFIIALTKFLARFPKKRSLKQKWWRESRRKRPKKEYKFIP